MSLLGFDALGKLALGEIPEGMPASRQLPPAPTRPRVFPVEPIVRSLALLVIASTPFVQSSWVHAKPVRLTAVEPVPYNQKIYTNPIPFGPFDYNKTVRVPSVPQPPHGMGYNANIYNNNIPFGPFDWSKAVRQKPQPDHPPYNLALLGTQVVAAPFALNDFGKTFVPTAAPPQLLPRNVNLFSEVPFAQYDWLKPVRVASVQPGHGTFNANLFTNPIPFAGADRSKPFDILGLAVFAPPLNLSLIAVVQSPFYLADWSITVRQRASAPDQAARNPLIFSEVPFSQEDWTTSKPVPKFAPADRPYNVLIYSEVPFGQSDWSKGQPVNTSPAWLPGYNGNLYGAVAPPPFAPIDWSKPFAVRSAPAAPATLNVNLYTNPIPFAQLDWSKPSAFTSASNALQQFNPNLSTVVVQSPFYQTDWAVTVRAKSSVVDQPLRNPLIFSEVPFNQGDWSKPARVASVPGAPLPFNLSLSIVVQNPFFQTDWSVTVRSRTAAVDQVARNILVLSEVPFFRTDWPKTFAIAGLPPGSGPLNVNLFSNPYPFAQYDWSKPQQSPNWQGAKSSDFNLSLSTAPVAPPFFQLDWSKPVNVAPVRPDQSPPNTVLLVTPPPPSPFYQLDWSKPYNIVGLPPQAIPFNINLYPGGPPAPPSSDQWSGKPKGNHHTGKHRKWKKIKLVDELEELIAELNKLATLSPKQIVKAPTPVILARYPQPIADALHELDMKQSARAIKQAVSRAQAEAEYQLALQRQQDEDDDDAALLLLS